MSNVINMYPYRLKKRGAATLASYEQDGFVLDEAIYTREEAERILADIPDDAALHEPDGAA